MAKKKSGLTGREALQQLKKSDKLRPIYYIYGEDPFLREEILEHLKGRIKPQLKDFNFHAVTGGEIAGDKIYALAQQLPMMDDYTLVIVREVQQIEKSDWDQLVPYLTDPSPTTCLVFLNPTKEPKVDKRTKVGKSLAPYFVDCKKPYDDKIPQWILGRAKRHHLRMDFDMAVRLFELLGSDLASLNNALERISLYLGGTNNVSIELIDEIIVENRSYNVFDLSDEIAQRNLQGALRLLRGLLAEGEAGLKLLALIARAFRMLLQARVDIDGGASMKSLEKYFYKVPRFILQKRLQQFIQQVKRFSLEELQQAMVLIQGADFSFKSSSGLTHELIMERLIIELCQLRIKPQQH